LTTCNTSGAPVIGLLEDILNPTLERFTNAVKDNEVYALHPTVPEVRGCVVG
jgi:hypothetical protein